MSDDAPGPVSSSRVVLPLSALALGYLAFLVALNLSLHHDVWYTENDLYFFEAMRLRQGEGYRDWIHPPGLVFLIRSFADTTGEALRAGQAVSHVSAAALALLFGLLAHRISRDRRAAVLAFLLVAANEAVLFNALLCATDLLFSALFAGALLCALPGERPVGPTRAAGAGALAAAMCLVRFQGYALLPGLALLAWFGVPDGRRRWPALLAGAAGFLMVYGPYFLYFTLFIGERWTTVTGLGTLDAHQLPEYRVFESRGERIAYFYALNAAQIAASALVLPLVGAIVALAREARGAPIALRAPASRGRAIGLLVLWGIYFAALGWHGVPGFFQLGRQHYLPILAGAPAVFAALAAPRLAGARGRAILIGIVAAAFLAGGGMAAREIRRADPGTRTFLAGIGAYPPPPGMKVVVGTPALLLHLPGATVWRPDKTLGPEGLSRAYCEHALATGTAVYVVQTVWLREAGLAAPYAPRCAHLRLAACNERLCAYTTAR